MRKPTRSPGARPAPLREAVEPDGNVRAVDRALALLLAFGDDDPALPLAEIARRTGLHMTTALRLLGTLEGQGFVQRVSDRYVDFSVPTMPNPILCLFAPHTSIPRFRQGWIGRQIPRSDVNWIGQILARLSPGQIRDAFRAAGYAPREVDAFTETVRTRIAVLGDL